MAKKKISQVEHNYLLIFIVGIVAIVAIFAIILLSKEEVISS